MRHDRVPRNRETRPLPPPKHAHWRDLTTEDFAGPDMAARVALLPIGAVEQHGPHLPLDTDTFLAEGIAAHAVDRVAPDVGVVVLPTVSVGGSDEHTAYPGTLSHAPETLIAMLTDIGVGVASAGLRRLVIFNAHGGQPQMVDIAALRLRLRHRMLVVKANLFRFGMPEGLFDDDEVRFGVHGGDIETSAMLHLCPDRVRMDRAGDFVPTTRGLTADGSAIGPGGAASFAWAAQDLHASGAAGNAAAATADKGRAYVDHAAAVLARIVEDAHGFSLDLLSDRP